MTLEHFKETIRKLCVGVEDLYIENSVYYELILYANVITVDGLREAVEAAQSDPKKRAEAHQAYSGMWKVLEETGTDALFQEMLDTLPPTDKPN